MEPAVADKILYLRDAIQKAAARVSRSAESIQVVLVTKTVAPEKIREAYGIGIRDFGENRIQELLQKKDQLPSDIRWHFIGRLQTNKVKFLLAAIEPATGLPPFLHSLDRLELAKEIEKQARVKGIKRVPCLIQMNSLGEKTKGGFLAEEIPPFVSGLAKDSPLWFRGLMTIGPLTEDKEKIRQAFRKIRGMQEGLQKQFPERNWDILSMGMSSDYEIAIEEGANLLRIGTAVFGSRAKR